MKVLNFVAIVILAGLITGCSYNKADIVYPNNNCDTTNMKYSENIRGIISSRCSGCHTGLTTSGINLDNHQALRAEALSGELLFRITTTDLDSRMPQPPNPPLDSCQVAQIRAWINSGAN